MANQINSAGQREAMLRRVAIVLSSLPPSTAAQLLGSIDPAGKQAIRRTMTTLADVDPLERQRALKAFKVSVQTPSEPQPATADRPLSDRFNADQAGARVMPGATVQVPMEPSPDNAQNTGPLSFLADVEDDRLLSLLSSEHPQAIALVLASISPVQAARLLPRLEPNQQTETLSRIGRLGEIPEEAVAEVAKHFQQRLERENQSEQQTRGTGQAALSAIMAALPSTSQTQAAASTPPPASVEPALAHDDPRPLSFPSADAPAVDLTHRLRVAEETWPEPEPVMEQAADPPVHAIPPAADSLGSTDAIHQHLIGMSPGELCQALGQVDTRIAMLTLCGLPNEVAEAVLAVLPKAQAKKVRVKMTTLGEINLREIDDAKELVARTSLSHVEANQHSIPMAA